MSHHQTAPEDLWAWAHESKPAPPDVSRFSVHVLVPGGAGAEWLPGLLASVASQTVSVSRVSVGAPGPDELAAGLPPTRLPAELVPARSVGELWAAVSASQSEFCWVLSGECVVPADTLEKLLRTVLDPAVAATGPVVLRQPTRRSDAVIEWVGATLTTTGVPISHEATGEVNQGQVEHPTVLGLPMAGLLVRTRTLHETGGFGTSPIPGLEVGVLSTMTGSRWVVTGDAEVTLVGPSTGSPTATRRAGMNLATTLARFAPWQAMVMVVAGLLGALGDLLVRDPRQAATALSALVGWLSDGKSRKEFRDRVARLPQTNPAAVAALRPHAGTRLRIWAEQVLGRFGDWVDGFSVRVDSGSALDDLTATDASAGSTVRWKLSPALVGLVTLLVLSCLSVVQLFRTGSIVGQQLLPAPDYSSLWASYLDPVAGQPGGSGAPWLVLVGLLSTITVGNVDLAIMSVLVLIVPVTWLACYRLLRQLLSDQASAVLVAVLVALSPSLVGATNRGDLGTSVALLFLVLGALSARRLMIEPTWRWTATVALCLTIAAVLFPLLWGVAVLAGIVAAILRHLTWSRLAVIAVVPLVFAASWFPTLWRWPGRLLTGPEPALATSEAPGFLGLLVARDGGSGLPPLWTSIVVVAAVALIALIGVIRVGAKSWFGWGVAAVGLAGAVGVSRVIVAVPPGADVRPEASLWLALFVSGLALAAGQGSDRVVQDLRGASFGWRQAAVAVLTIAALGAGVIAGGWWVFGGAKDLARNDMSAIAPYVRKAQVSDTPGRTLAISIHSGGKTSWALLEGDLPRLGDGERGLAAGGSPTVTTEAAGVVDRLLAGAADDRLLSDLRSLGVGYVWVQGPSADDVANIGNTPGLGAGTGDDTAWVWQVPDSGRATISAGEKTTVVGSGMPIDASDAARVLILSEPADPRWQATVGGHKIEALPTTDWRQRFALPVDGGQLEYELQGSSWWAWIQLALLGIAIVMVAPSHRSQVGARGAMS